MEINITDFFYIGQAHLYSASAAELGENAGKITWNNSRNYADKHRMLVTDEQLEAFRSFVKDTGGWTNSEIRSWTDQELNALFVQFIAGDIREAGLDIPFPDWEQYQEEAEAGRVSGRIFKIQDGQVYYNIGN